MKLSLRILIFYHKILSELIGIPTCTLCGDFTFFPKTIYALDELDLDPGESAEGKACHNCFEEYVETE